MYTSYTFYLSFIYLFIHFDILIPSIILFSMLKSALSFFGISIKTSSSSSTVVPLEPYLRLGPLITEAIIASPKYIHCHAPTRVECNKDIQDTTTYNGSVYYWLMIKIAYATVKANLDEKMATVKVINAQRWQNDFKEGSNGEVFATGQKMNHPYLLLIPTDKSDPIIIDVLLRMIFMLHRGLSKKWVSPYGNEIYEKVPVVWIGTHAQLKARWTELDKLRKLDPLHSTKDDIVTLGDPMDYFDFELQKPNIVADFETVFKNVE